MPEPGKSLLQSANRATMSHAQTSPSALDPQDMVTVLRSVPFGGMDDTARHLAVSPQARASLSPVISSFRWSAVMYGMIFGAAEAFKGSYAVVATLSVCLFLTSWRTIIPIQLGSTESHPRTASITDTLILGSAIGFSGGPTSPFVFSLLAAVVVTAVGWGYVNGMIALVVGWIAMLTGRLLMMDSPIAIDRSFGLLAGSMLLMTLGAALLRSRLLDAELRRRELAGQVNTLAEANDLLTMLNSVARTLPTSLNQREALEAVRLQIIETFHATTICLLEFDETHDEWTPKITEGCAIKPLSSVDELPVHLRQAMDSEVPWLVPNLSTGSLPGISPVSGSGLYTQLVSRGRTVGVLGIEHQSAGQYSERDRLLLAGMADVVALSLDNARWFGRLRSLGAEEERVRIARDLHDRLGQWLTYISFELERFIDTDGAGFVQLQQLYADVQTALDELRETLRQLRAGIAEGRPLVVVGQELIDRFSTRTGLSVNFNVSDPRAKLPIPVENELLRILQEALNNVDKHAKAETVEVTYRVSMGTGELSVSDDGRGFDAARGVRDSAYGLVGMRERADVIGARFAVQSVHDVGTTVKVTVGSVPNGQEG